MSGLNLFSIYYPAHAAALRGTSGLLVTGTGSSLDNLSQGDFRDTQPASVLSSPWGRLPLCVEIPLHPLFRPDDQEPVLAFIASCGNGRSASGGSGPVRAGLQFSGKEEGTESADSAASHPAGGAETIGVPTLPGTMPGVSTFDALVHALAEAGLAANPGSQKAELLGPVWLKAPGMVSVSADSLEALRTAYFQMVVKDVASQATVAKYVPGAVVVEVDLNVAPDGGSQIVSLRLKKRSKISSENPALQISDLPEGKNRLLFQAASAIVRREGIVGPATVKFLFDPSSREVFFLKLK